MDFREILNEELNVQFVNKELAGLEASKKQLDAVVQQNPLIGKQIAAPIAEIDKKITSLKYAVAEYVNKEKMQKKAGVGSQTQAQPTLPTPAAKPAPATPAAAPAVKPAQ